jgi:hypothetical protein
VFDIFDILHHTVPHQRAQSERYMASKLRNVIIGISLRSAILAALVLGCALTTRADSLTITYQDFTEPYMPAMVVTSSPSAFPAGVYGAGMAGSYGSGAGISYSVSGSANPPGTSQNSPTVAYLSTSEFKLTNSTGTPHHIVITFDAQTFTLPSANSVMIDTVFTTHDATGQLGNDPSRLSSLTASASGGVTYSRTAPLGQDDNPQFPVSSGPLSKSGGYSLHQIFDFWIADNPGGNSIYSEMLMDVGSGPGEPTPEPWTVAGAASMLPILGAFGLLRRRKKALNQV